ncbi:MAG TPA: condensation domain-containing protein, partial [Thermoanaerobaculia bacterium]|nr:condensation domain-containing protein [Thermoanaerobaculia bacterium]
RLHGRLDVDALRAALDRLVARHESLRTTFDDVDGVPFQRFASADCGFALRQSDLRALSAEEREKAVAVRAAEEARAPFDLCTGPLIRGQLLRLADDEHVLLVTQHHIVSDGWSLGVFVREVAALYTAFRRGEPDPLPPLEIQYADYAQWQRDWLQDEELARQIAFWKEHLAGAPALLTLPLDRPRPAVQSHAGGTVPLALSEELTARLRDLAQRHGVTLFMTLLAAWGVLLSRLSGQSDIVIGTPVANRQRREIENLIGFFVNTLAVRLRLADLNGLAPSAAELLRQVRETTLAAFAHQELPFEQVVEALQPVRSLGHSPLFQTMLALNNINTYGEGSLELPELTLSRVAREQKSTQFDLSLALHERGDRLVAQLDYATALFDESTIERWAGHYVRLLEGMVNDDAAPVDALPLLSDDERRRVLLALNDTATDRPAETLVHALFEKQAAAQPDAIAVVHDDRSLTYGELNDLANRIAHRLLTLGVQPDDRVALCADRSPETIAALLGILKAGGAYVPLDPATPAERLRFLLRDAEPKVVLTDGTASIDDIPVLRFDDETLSFQPASNPDARANSRNLAYVIYTSGSTGVPKGVMIEHRGVVNMATAQIAMCGLTREDRVLQFASLGFDSSVAEIFPALSTGAAVVLRQAYADPDQFASLLDRHRVTVADLPTAFWRHWSQLLRDNGAPAGKSLRLVIVSGETLERRDVETWFSHPGSSRVALLNNYGPTEATVNATAFAVDPAQMSDGAPVPIGRPIANTRIYILDRRGEPVP